MSKRPPSSVPATQEATLPGLDLTAVITRAEQFEDNREKQYTAERLLVSHPDTYAIASRLFFEIGLSKRAVCDCCKLSSRTLNALIEREMRTRGAEVLYENVRRKKSMITYELMEQLEDLVNDEDAVRDAGISGLIAALKTLNDEGKPAKSSDASSNDSPKSAVIDTETVEYAQIYRMSRQSNGLDRAENSAPRVDVSKVVEVGEEGADADESGDNYSVTLSDNPQHIKGISTSVDNVVDNFGGNRSGAASDTPAVGRFDPTPGGRGARGEVGAPPFHYKCIAAERTRE